MEKKLSPRKVKYLFTTIIAAFASFFIIYMSQSFSDKIIETYQKSFVETTNLVAEGYTELAEEKLKGYAAIIDTFYDEKVFAGGNEAEIVLSLNRQSDKLPDDFLNIFYFNKDGVSIDLNGNIREVRDRDYYTAIIYSGATRFITGAIEAKLDNTLIFIVARATYDKNGRINGGLCGTIKLYSFADFFLGQNIIDGSEMTILDKNGHFVVNKKREKIGKNFVPADKDYAQYRTENIAKIKSGSVITKTAEGNTISLIFRPIKTSGWVLCLVLPADNVQQNMRQRTIIKLLMTLISLVVIFLLFFGELKLLDFFQKKEFLFIDYDPVTGLWSTDRFMYEAEKLIRHNKNSKYMLLDCDIQGFNFIAQKYDENQLKKLLKFTAHEVKKTADKFNGICGRGSSDHFFLFYKVSSVKNAMRQFKDHAKTELAVTDNYKIAFALKFGIAFMLPTEKYKGLTIQALINQTSIAKKNIRKESDLLYSIYDPKYLKRIQNEYFLESQCEKALQNNDFFVVYQPKINLKTEKVIGAEALVRWRHPERGVIPPNDFIPLFERTGFVTRVDFFVYEEVLKFLDARIKAGLPVVQISVNMSRNHNKPERFIDDFLNVFKKYNVPAKYIQVEILERSFTENRILAQITELLHKNGFTVAMDDFGTGESSLSMLTQVPIDVLKFDRSFLLSSTNSHGEIDRKSAGFIESFVGLSKRLEKETVFEGVETESQRDFLRVIDCDTVQGYFYSKPLIQKDFEVFLEEHF